MRICEWCHQEMQTAETCTSNIIEIDGQVYGPIPADEDCAGCWVKQGGIHHPGCDVELCSCCGEQRVYCKCENPRCEKCGERMEYEGSDDKKDYFSCENCESDDGA